MSAPKPQVLVVGALPWFADSFRLFTEKGARCAYVRLPKPPLVTFAYAYTMLSSAGFAELPYDLEAIAAFLAGGEPTVIMSGGEFLPRGAYFHEGDSVEKLEAFGEIAAMAGKRGFPTLAVRFFNGENYFLRPEVVTKVERCLAAADTLFYDNETLAEYVTYNCPGLAQIPGRIVMTEVPLERFFPEKVESRIAPFVFLAGRWPPSSLHFTPARRRDQAVVRLWHALGREVALTSGTKTVRSTSLSDQTTKITLPLSVSFTNRQVASSATIAAVDHQRQLLRAEQGRSAAGLSHFYDYPRTSQADTPREERLGFIGQRCAAANHLGYSWPAVMRAINYSSKAITYLMLGIPPLVPDDDLQPLTAKLKARNLCIPVNAANDDWAADLLDRTTLIAKREAILQNKREFAFERVLEHLNDASRRKFRQDAIASA